MPVVQGRTVSGGDLQPVALGEDPGAGLFGTLAPVAALSPDGASIVYSAWTELVKADSGSPSEQGIQPGTPVAEPSLRVFDLRSGEDHLFAKGAFSAGFRNDGALAYFQGAQAAYVPRQPFVGDIMVLDRPGGEAEPWTVDDGRYVVVAWAGKRLLAYRIGEGDQVDLLALDGPGKVGVLAEASSLVALRPDGGRALVVSGADSGALVLMDVADGAVLRTYSLGALTGDEVAWISYGGSWTGDRVVASGGLADGTSPVLVVFSATGDHVAVEEILKLDPDALPYGIEEPRLVPGDTDHLVGWAPMPPAPGASMRRSSLVDCDLARLTCSVGSPMEARTRMLEMP